MTLGKITLKQIAESQDNRHSIHNPKCESGTRYRIGRTSWGKTIYQCTRCLWMGTKEDLKELKTLTQESQSK